MSFLIGFVLSWALFGVQGADLLVQPGVTGRGQLCGHGLLHLLWMLARPGAPVVAKEAPQAQGLTGAQGHAQFVLQREQHSHLPRSQAALIDDPCEQLSLTIEPGADGQTVSHKLTHRQGAVVLQQPAHLLQRSQRVRVEQRCFQLLHIEHGVADRQMPLVRAQPVPKKPALLCRKIVERGPIAWFRHGMSATRRLQG